VDRGHFVAVLKGYYSTYHSPCRAQAEVGFNTTDNLAVRLQELARERWDAVFHSAAVSDFCFGRVFLRRQPAGDLEEIRSGKFGTRFGPLMAELLPTPKIIASLRRMFGPARLFGWKFEVQGGREHAIELGRLQISENQTDFCVVNGPAYGAGYGIVARSEEALDCPTVEELYERLEKLAAAPPQGIRFEV
jgi:phosphopantothenoylcysteine decarboxylase/phosphopantothenate--cysteine ligase